MEENKEAKVVDMMSTEGRPMKPEKLSYEQLENVASQLSNQAKQLYAKLQEANMTNMFKRLDYLFKVVDSAHAFNEEFVNKCVTEIEYLMTVPEDNKETESESKE